MKIETSFIQKIRITDLASLDPIEVFLEDQGPGQGKITLTCYTQSWTAGWGAMGKETIAEFFSTCDTDYLIRNLSGGLSPHIFSGQALALAARQVILGRRRSSLRPKWDDAFETYDAQQARALYEQVGEELTDDLSDIWQAPTDLMTELFGEEYWYASDRADAPNPDYHYLTRIIEAVQGALKQLPAPTLAEAA